MEGIQVYCLNCRAEVEADADVCPVCGADPRVKSPAPVLKTSPFVPMGPAWMSDTEMAELARQYRAAHSACWTNFWLGFVAFIPWAFVYLERTKMEAIRLRVAAKGYDAAQWSRELIGK
jgi:hypothetical protein